MAASNSWWKWQIAACGLIAAAGLVPHWTWTAGFWQVQYSQFGDAPPQIDAVGLGSPAAAAGLQAGDAVLAPASFDQLQTVFRSLRAGQQRTIRVRRGDSERELLLVGQPPELAAIWYPHVWYPLAGSVALLLAWGVLASSALSPPPIWRGVVLGAVGFGLAAGFAWAWYVASPFGRIIVRQWWTMVLEHDRDLGQAALGFLASLGLAALAALELRGRARSNKAAANSSK